MKSIRPLTNDEQYEMEKYRKRKTRITSNDMVNVKKLFDNYGISYIEAVGEADELCYKLVNSGLVYACLSDDTDMFVYGTNTIIKNLNLFNLTVDIFHIQDILSMLKVNLYQFRLMCILSGTDYTVTNVNGAKSIKKSIFTNYKDIQIYKKEVKTMEYANKDTLIQWFIDNNNIDESSTESLNRIYSIYNIDTNVCKSILDIVNEKKLTNINKVCQLLKEENFIV